ncbi:MAG: hypothetical protein C5B52_10175 [Bacteroidetes bacterium]|nr:MAG: hypothetical protein C5B52_10175 [Bacteroidota bacterium]
MPKIPGVTNPLVRLSLSLLTIISLLTARAQSSHENINLEYSYTHYDVRDGLASSTIYNMTQDKDGFIWFATETGITRYDGTHFKNFTTQDGLTDNEVIRVVADSRGRVWIAPFKKSICYYYKGKIYNESNDSMLAHLKLNVNVLSFQEDENQNIGIPDEATLRIVKTDGSVKSIEMPGTYNRNIQVIGKAKNGGFHLLNQKDLIKVSENEIKIVYPNIIRDPLAIKSNLGVLLEDNFLMADPSGETFTLTNIHTKQKDVVHLPNHAISISIYPIDDSTIFFNTSGGSFIFGVNSKKFTNLYLKTKAVNYCIRDTEGNIWISTLGNGVYKISSLSFRRIASKTMDSNSEIFTIEKNGNNLILGGNYGNIYEVQNLKNVTIHNVNQIDKTKYNRIIFILNEPDYFFAGTDNEGLVKVTENGARPIMTRIAFDIYPAWMPTIAMKCMVRIGDSAYVIGTHWGIFTFKKNENNVRKQILTKRVTALFYRNDSLYIGFMDGLSVMLRDHSIVDLAPTNSFFKNRITAITESNDGTLWFASSSEGVMGLHRDHSITRITTKTGLSSDLCKSLRVSGSTLWIGTAKGLNKINLKSPNYVMAFEASESLLFDAINSIYVNQDTVYVGTPKGLVFFDSKESPYKTNCRLKLMSVQVSGNEIDKDKPLKIEYNNNRVRFEYVGITFRSYGEILYKYRLVGLDTSWRTTKETILDFTTLPPGNYRLELEAVGAFFKSSNSLVFPFVVAPPYWQTFWFIGLMSLLLVLLTWFVIHSRIKAIKRKQEERIQMQQQLFELEQKALRAQMNPHFIFNCLNSIQGYIIEKDLPSANKYLSNFAGLIRQTLDNSARSMISIADEMKYLSTYLELEKMRFSQKFEYAILIDPNVIASDTFIPNMILQPYIENAIRHGLQHKNENNGRIDIKISSDSNDIVFKIEDNGIGREAAQKLKSSQHIEYQSKGMIITQERIDIIKMNTKADIKVHVEDVVINGRTNGTLVTLSFPKSFTQKIDF